ncbi:DUF397 domain-containing protein [Nocardia jiangsuensis]|uniref:DUF397 domain-containing protein n=1 Tax=Nocardia jiangsuensis TaxID=1691563 RepID=A0ABV8DPS5_9NOCA
MTAKNRLNDWTTSSFSGNNGGACVEVKIEGDAVLVRDSKFRRDPGNRDRTQPQIGISVGAWTELCQRMISMTSFTLGEALRVTVHNDGAATFENWSIRLNFTPDEMDAFAKGVIDGEFTVV